MELTQEQIEQRAHTIASGTYRPEIPGLSIIFVRMSLADTGASSRAYSSKLKELFDVGGYFTEYALPSLLKKICKDNELDYGALQKKRMIMERLYKTIPEELAGPYDQLTDEEVAQLSEEARRDREQGIRERGQRAAQWLADFYTEEDREVLDAAEQIERLEQHLRSQTAEHLARKHQMEVEIFRCVRKADSPEDPFFHALEQIQQLPSAILTQLYLKWKQFREGMTDNFFSPSS